MDQERNIVNYLHTYIYSRCGCSSNTYNLTLFRHQNRMFNFICRHENWVKMLTIRNTYVCMFVVYEFLKGFKIKSIHPYSWDIRCLDELVRWYSNILNLNKSLYNSRPSSRKTEVKQKISHNGCRFEYLVNQ